MFPHFIASDNHNGKRKLLWQLNHYHYEIECEGIVVKELLDTSFEEARVLFDNYTPQVMEFL